LYRTLIFHIEELLDVKTATWVLLFSFVAVLEIVVIAVSQSRSTDLHGEVGALSALIPFTVAAWAITLCAAMMFLHLQYVISRYEVLC
jgi:F0F1-type ATP synthase assembly protein I